MKHFLRFLLLLLITGAWIYVTTLKYSGLNAVQHLVNYRYGLPGRSGLPKDSLVSVKCPAGNAQVNIDTLGIPHIYGDNPNALAFAAGYMHARDRYFQMELLAHAVMGRLSEIIGPAGIGSDKQWKMFDLEAKARLLLDSLSVTQPDLFHYLDAYASGVNAYIAQEAPQYRDPMYTIWDYSPRPWKAYYAFLMQWYMAFNLSFYDDYVDKQELLDKLPDTLRHALYPAYPADQPSIIPGPARQPAQALQGQALAKLFQPQQPNHYAARPHLRSLGSNNWVVSADSTRTGALFLCNDLHLFLAAPNIFYEMQLCSPEIHVYGYTVPGVPVVLTGHNEKIAWGITSGEWDVTEQYLLKLDPRNEHRYWLDGKWQAMTPRDFTISVKGQAPEQLEVQYTVFGPLVKREALAYGLMWHPQQSASAVSAFWKLMQAPGWHAFREALRLYDYPSQNFAYGDVQGNIGMICAGKMPVKPVNYAGGLLDGTHTPQWRYIPFDSLPQVFNPARPYLFSANQEPQHGRYYFSSRWFADQYRPARIDEMLAAGKRWTWEDMQQMQLDVTDLSVKALQALFARYLPDKAPSGHWASFMRWDGRLNPRREEAILYKFFRQATWMVGNELAGKMQVRAAPDFDQLMYFLKQSDTVAVHHHVLYSRDYFLRLIHLTDSLYDSYNRVRNKPAIDPPYSFDVPSITFLPGLSRNIRDVGGSENTINVNYGAHAVIRTVIAIRDSTIQSRMVNAIGQTGRINEKKYYQQLYAWKQNLLHPTQFTASPAKLQAITTRIIFSDH